MKTLLAIGDWSDWDSYKKFVRKKPLCRKRGFNFLALNYDSIFDDKLPDIKNKTLVFFFFFPFGFWKKKIETKKYLGVYGNQSFYLLYIDFWKQLKKRITRRYPGKKIFYINDPNSIVIDRDKLLTRKVLDQAAIPVSPVFRTRRLKNILELINNGKRLYLKIRYGSMGKGITYIEKDRWVTNFGFRNGQILSRKSDYGWKFRDVTNNRIFLKVLLQQDLIIEEAINPLLLKGKKFDFRIYVCFGKILFIYPRSTDPRNITTNISQGATGERQLFLNGIPEKVIKRAKKHAINAVKSMNLNFAGVDIMPHGDKQDLTVIEVNTFPGFPRVRDFPLSEFLMKAILGHNWS